MPYQPKPLDTTQVQLPDELTALIERLAENTHENWAALRLADGWTYGPRRDDERKQHPGLVAYAELSEGEKEYDRATAVQASKRSRAWAIASCEMGLCGRMGTGSRFSGPSGENSRASARSFPRPSRPAAIGSRFTSTGPAPSPTSSTRASCPKAISPRNTPIWVRALKSTWPPSPTPLTDPAGEAATATLPVRSLGAATAALMAPASFPDRFEVLVFEAEEGATLVAAVELVSPANKDRPAHRRAFAVKCASYLCKAFRSSSLILSQPGSLISTMK